MLKEELFEGFSVNCEVIRMGKDYTLAVYGGDTPHAGSVVMTVARPSLTGKGIGVTTSVLTGAGHKDDIIARLFSEALAESRNCTVVCSCGIHVDNIRPEQLEIVREKCGDLLQRLHKEEDDRYH